MSNELKLGLIGLDTSHVIKFTELLNNPEHPHHVAGARVVAGYPGGSPDVEASHTRVEGFTRQLAEQHGVDVLETPEAVAEQCDALLITSVDGRTHRELFERIAPYRRPVFIDKPFTCSLEDAEAIYRLAAVQRIPVMTTSVLRYLEAFERELDTEETVEGIDCFTPLVLEPTNPGWFWYGIHGVEMLFRALGTGCAEVTVTAETAGAAESGHAADAGAASAAGTRTGGADTDSGDAQVANVRAEIAVARWADGRIGTIRGNRTRSYHYGATLHFAGRSAAVSSASGGRPMQAGLLERVLHMFRTGEPDVSPQETLAMIRFIEAVNTSRTTGTTVKLQP
ncbi:Gfo/Idh/MocA family oxidoreductase [Paenibacillus sp. IB182496]|uniref:Gfo/Idh/MocA family oxidoreductase n=1 Tax=Paenibacillus sabuli TaxID=2772509 RepID=A0A927BWS5_9BACL|nr:Gfo/Idh/MocA family oxidoreductase [Paenibacillus sabuli]MBD2847060.1 Gfo/Idh/MocA family oxidoreductase [Paenibacillus sabuli]